jgi:hypothetical protein
MEQYNPPFSATAKIINKNAAICALLLLLSDVNLFPLIVLGNPNYNRARF